MTEGQREPMNSWATGSFSTEVGHLASIACLQKQAVCSRAVLGCFFYRWEVEWGLLSFLHLLPSLAHLVSPNLLVPKTTGIRSGEEEPSLAFESSVE